MGGARGRPPLEAEVRFGSGERDYHTFEVACGKCGIVKHPRGPVSRCMTKGGCHICWRRGRGGRGCCLEEECAFFFAMIRDLDDDSKWSDEWIEARWQEWKHQLGLN